MDYYIDTFPGREIIINQKTYLYFGGTSYLGLQTDSAYKDLFIKNVKKYGTNYGASRKSNIRLSIYEEAESYLANWTGSEACLTLSSGYLAGQLVSGYFNTDQYKPFYAPNSHPALFGSGGGRAGAGSYTTYTSLEAALRKHLDKNVGIVPVVFLDSIDISGANYPDFKGIHSLPLKDIIIVADDSHGIGVVGKRGAGVFSILKDLEPAELIVCYSLGKALGIQGGAVLGTSKRIEDLKMTDFFGGASPVAPAYLATLIQGEDIIRRKRELLMEYMDLFTAKIGFDG
jgi:7-keto-8-aminopelargonate synthetase-like enzyme